VWQAAGGHGFASPYEDSKHFKETHTLSDFKNTLIMFIIVLCR